MIKFSGVTIYSSDLVGQEIKQALLTSTNILEDVGSQIPENLFKGKVLWIFSGCLVRGW